MDGNNSDPMLDSMRSPLSESQDKDDQTIDLVDGLRLLRAFTGMSRAEDRRMIIELAERLARQSAH